MKRRALFIAGFEGIYMMIFGGGLMMIFPNWLSGIFQKIRTPAVWLPGGAVRLAGGSRTACVGMNEPYGLREGPCGL